MSYLTLIGQKEHLREARDRLSRHCCPFTTIEDRTRDTPMLEYLCSDDPVRKIRVLDATPQELHDFFGYVLRDAY